MVLYNGTSVKKGGGTYSHGQPLQAGESVNVVLKYFASKRGVIPQPVIGLKGASPVPVAKTKAARAVAPIGAPFSISSCSVQPDRSVVLEFPSEPGRSYRVQYSPDAVHWKACPATITSAGTRIQWIDRGPPSTENAPATTPSRFYRIERLES